MSTMITLPSARRKKPIRSILAENISQALYERSFEYQKRGRK